jgi:hypothetical protein
LEGPHLPEAIRNAYLDLQAGELRWLTGVLDEGKQLGIFGSKNTSEALALGILQKGVGIQLVARISGHSIALSSVRDQVFFALQLAH